MSNNIVDKNVSDKVVWENGLTPDNDFTPAMSQARSEFQPYSQPQMMFCYKCNNVVPTDSKYCPYCKVELYTICPKCGQKYSSQYPICNQCGTNRQEYLEIQRREQERNERRKRVERIRQEELERQKQEKDRLERLEKARVKALVAKEKEDYLAENKDITKTMEYTSTYSLLAEALNTFEQKSKQRIIVLVALLIIGFISLYLIPLWIIYVIYLLCLGSDKGQEKFLLKHISGNNHYYNQDELNYLIKMISYQGKERLSDCCVIAYRKKHNLTINYKWHSLR